MDSKTTRHDTSPRQQTVVEPTQSDADRIARFYDRLLKMKENELAAELEAIRESFEGEKSDLSRLQLALLLSLPGTTFRDDNAALTVLNPFLNDKVWEVSNLRPLALWLNAALLELRRTEESSQQQSAKLKEELRRSDEAMQQQAAKLKEEQRRTEALQQKLDAILDMEMKMIEREQNVPKKK
ncbi:MAG: hypothetical protein H7X76_06995 [Prolixibacteraceae bacterium]|nr:hypothetical protein [Burkholderiales bacterium]